MKRQILVFPTWVLYKLSNKRIKPEHPWYKRNFSLKNWAAGSTKLNDQLSLSLWVGIIFLLIGILLHIIKFIL